MNQVSEDVRDKLVADEIVDDDITKQWFVTVGRLPDFPLEAVSLREGVGSGPEHDMDKDTIMENEALQVFVRGRDQRTSWGKAKAIAQHICAWGRFSQGSSRYEYIYQQGSIAEFSHNRSENVWTWVMNFNIKRKEA